MPAADDVGKEMATVAPTDDATEADQSGPRASLAELYQFASAFEKLVLAVAVVGALGAGASMPMMLIAFGGAFDQLGVAETVPGQSVLGSFMDTMLLQFVYVGIGMGGGKLIYVACVQYVCSAQILKYKVQFLKAVLRQDVAWYDSSSPEELTTKFESSMVKVKKGLSASAFLLFEGLGYGLGSLILGFYYQWAVSLITFATVPLLIIPASYAMHIVEKGGQVITKAYGHAGGVATEALFAVRTVVSLGIEDQFEKRYNSSLGGARKATVRNMTAFGVSVGMALSAYLIMMAVAIIYGAFTLAGEMDKSEFKVSLEGDLGVINMTCQTADAYSRAEGFLNVTNRNTPIDVTNEAIFREYLKEEAPKEYLDDNSQYYACATKATNVLLAILLIMSAGEGFSMAGTPAAVISEARYAAARVLEIINRAPAIDSFSEDGLKPHTCGGEIEVRDVVFAYPTAADHLVANGFSLSIPAGKTMALCGASGSGKSTLIQLLERFYDPQSGVITLDGHDIKTLNVRWLRGQLGLVGQEPVLFQGTVAQNIAYGKQTAATQEEIEAAAKKANAHGFITENLQNGYETEIGVRGGRLSGGQKQRVAIARALIKKPAVLLLDEATSALDNQSESVVQAALDGVMAAGGLTTVVIAHRLSTIRNADCIAVVNEGKVVEKGTFSALYGQGGVFHNLAKKQEEHASFDKVIKANAANPVVEGISGAVDSPIDLSGGNGEGKQMVKNIAEGAEENKETSEEEDGQPMLPAISRLLGMQTSHQMYLIFMCIFSAGASICPSIAFYFMVEVMSLLYEPDADKMREEALRIATLLGIMAACTVAGFGLSHLCNGISGAALTAKLRAQGMSSLLRQDIAYFDKEENSPANLTSFLSEKVDKVQTLTTEQLDLIAQLLGGVGSSVVIIFWMCSWRLGLLWAAVMPVLSIITSLELAFISGGDDALAEHQGKEVDNKMTRASKSANQIVGEAVMGIRTVASYNLEQRFYDGFCLSSGTVADYMKRDAMVQGFFQMVSNLCMVTIFGGVMYYGVWLANQGLVDFKGAIGPMFVIMGAMVPMMKMSALANIKSATASAWRLFNLFDRQPDIDASSPDGAQPKHCSGQIEVRDVVFAYPTAADHLVANGFSLSIPAGKTMALCGASGSGKSTLIQLLERFYDPQSGVITLDGHDIKTLNVRWLRGQLGLVGQEPVLFQGTVAQNIAYGKQTAATQEEIEAAAKKANAHGFITENLQNGYETEVGLQGGRLSGGQKQRVAIARALIKKPAVLLLDEATSALDNQSESVVQAALDGVMAAGGLTTVVIAHRLSTIRNADCIAVVNEGRVVEKGTHEELLGEQGLYASLVLSHS